MPATYEKITITFASEDAEAFRAQAKRLGLGYAALVKKGGKLIEQEEEETK